MSRVVSFIISQSVSDSEVFSFYFDLQNVESESLDYDNLRLQVTKYLANNPTIMINYNLSLLSNIPSLIFSM